MNASRLSPLTFAPAVVDVVERQDGSVIVRSPQQLGPYARCLGDMLCHWAETTPAHPFLAERGEDGDWRKLGYRDALRAVEAIAQFLIDQGLGPSVPLLILSENGIDHALLALAGMHVGVPVAPVSVAYSSASQDLGKVKHILSLLKPGLVYAADGDRFGRALALAEASGARFVTSRNHRTGSTPFNEMMSVTPTGAVADTNRRVGPDTIAKILFTSGSTDTPKGVKNTQRMLCSNQQATAQLWPFLANRPPVVVDWLPWSHTMGGNWIFNMVLAHGGTLHIDEGRPMPGALEKTVANLKAVSPTLYFNVPRGFDMLLPYLEADEDLRNSLFRDLDLMFYAGAALPQKVWDGLQAVAQAHQGRPVRLMSALGSTETSPMLTLVHFDIDRAGIIGLPGPGNQIRLVPNNGKLECRVKGPNITPGYWGRDDLTSKAFDDDGWYITGDAVQFVDSRNPHNGIRFDGRIAEDFKLMSGVWVSVGALRLAAISACAPVIADAVITGHDREEIGMLVFPNPAGCLSLCPDISGDIPLPVLIRRHEVRSVLERGLKAMAATATGSSMRICRAWLLDVPPSIDANEITDKGYINQRAVLVHRAELVERLYRDDESDVVRV
ncbi:feruloyl-CoA synthase [Magnetospirillum sp. 15-1]|uniref:feruloyl-CoA synthase n=1 Tax=Magnetospirillum sp. 15-1 TaxID=1979370 RepID=UPI000BBCD713|nr:feruloyl-CoA synthase [Magnetospirillum sp. 15-1]